MNVRRSVVETKWNADDADGYDLIWFFYLKRITGKLLLSKNLVAQDFRGELKLDLINGIYFVNLINEKGSKTVKKLVIAK